MAAAKAGSVRAEAPARDPHRVAWQDRTTEARAEGDGLIAAIGARADPEAPLARVGLETDGRPDVTPTLITGPGGREPPGRVDLHGRRVVRAGARVRTPRGVPAPGACMPSDPAGDFGEMREEARMADFCD